jgi:hypothetical protein
MKETQPMFREGSLPWLLFPDQQVVSQTDSAEGASGCSNVPEAALNKAIQNQGLSLHRISSSVDELQDTMADLKQSFRALRLELNTTSSYRGQVGQCDEAMDMLKIVLKELQSKADEIEKLKLQNDSLKLKSRHMEERQQNGPPLTPRLLDGLIPAVQSPGFLDEHEGHQSPRFITTGRVADSFEGDNESIDHATVFEPAQPVKIPLKPAAETLPMHIRQSQDDRHSQGTTRPRRDSGEPATKRQRLNNVSEESGSPATAQPVRERQRGRPRRSQASIPHAQQIPNPPTTTSMVDGQEAVLDTSVEDSSVHPVEEVTSSEGPKPRGRPRTISKSSSTSQAKPKVTRRRSKAQDTDSPKPPESQDKTIETNDSLKTPAEVAVSVAELTPESEIESHLSANRKEGGEGGNRSNSKERKNRVSDRDTLAKAAMEREEAMADG